MLAGIVYECRNVADASAAVASGSLRETQAVETRWRLSDMVAPALHGSLPPVVILPEVAKTGAAAIDCLPGGLVGNVLFVSPEDHFRLPPNADPKGRCVSPACSSGPASYPRLMRCCAAFAKIDGTEAREAEKLRGPHAMPLCRAFEILELLIGRITDHARLWMSFGR